MTKGGTQKGDWRKRMRGFVKANTSLTIIISALLLIELMMGVIYYAAQNFIQNTMERLVRVEMNAIYLCIRNKLATVEVTLDNMAWVVGESLEEPEWMIDLTHRMVKNNPVFWGSGVAFDPTLRWETDITLSAADRQIGGLGIHLVRELMDSINYEREAGKNILTLIKKLK